MVARLVVAISFLLVMFTVVDAFAFSSGSRRNNTAASTSSTNVVKAVEPTSVYALASGVLLLGGAAWLIRRK
jgi:hypothetical protein